MEAEKGYSTLAEACLEYRKRYHDENFSQKKQKRGPLLSSEITPQSFFLVCRSVDSVPEWLQHHYDYSTGTSATAHHGFNCGLWQAREPCVAAG